jgi:tetratricopeptide (TPR) repeat protein
MNVQAIAELMRAGRLAEARAASEAALAGGDQTDAMLAVAAMLAARANDPAGAAPHLENLLRRNPADRATRVNLAQAFSALGRHDEVAAVCAAMRGDAALDRLAAFAAQQQGDTAQARDLYRSVVTAHKQDADSWANLGNAYAALGQTDEAVDAFERAITLRPDDVRFYLNLAGVLERAERPTERRTVARDAVKVRPDDAEAQLALGLAEAAAGDTDAAVTALQRSIALAPASPGAYLELGLLFETTNQLPALDALIEQARPNLGPELALLEASAAFRAQRFADARRFADAIPDTVAPMRRHQVRAMIADRENDAVAAFDLYKRMNEAAIEMSPPAIGRQTYRDMVTAQTAAWRSNPIGSVVAIPADDVPEPVFIVGFPRSGTTLLDTIIGSLPATHVLEEQPLLPEIEHRVGSADRIATLDAAAIFELRARYVAHLLRIAPDSAGKRIVDKHPLHMTRMPLIHRLFPTAKILFVERHPCDVVLSCFMANFKLNAAMRSFTDLEEAARTYDAVLTAWRAARDGIKLDVHPVRYERLVSAPEAEVRAALMFLGARYDPAILDTVNAARERGPVRTASYAQITEPIYQRSVARWERYRDELAPVLPILEPWVSYLGYEM